MDKRYPQKQTRDIPKQTRDIPTSKTSRPKSFDVQRSSRQAKDAGPSHPQNKQNPLKRTESAQANRIRSSEQNPLKRTESAQASSSNPKDLKSKPEAARSSTSNPKDLKSKPGKHSASRHYDAILQQVNQTVWKKQQHGDHGASNSHQRQNSSAQLGWQQAMLRHSSKSSLGGRSFNPSLRRKIRALAGGGDPDDSSSQQQPKDESWPIGLQKNFQQAIDTYNSGNNVSQSQNEINSSKPTYQEVLNEVNRPSMDEVWNSIEKRGTYN